MVRALWGERAPGLARWRGSPYCGGTDGVRGRPMGTYGSPVAWETAGRPGDAERFSEGLLSPCVCVGDGKHQD